MVQSTYEQLRRQNFFDSLEAQADPQKEAGPQSLRQSFAQGFAQGDEAAEVDEPWFPDIEYATQANQQALLDHGQEAQAGLGALRPDVLESALGRAQNYYYYEDDPFKAAAALGHGIGQAQAFEDGNKRTAFHTVREFLHDLGYPHISPPDEDDDEYAQHLVGYGEGTHQMEDTADLFRARHEAWLKANGY